MNQLQSPAPIKLKPEELAWQLLPELEAYHAIYTDKFRRREQIEHSLTYLQGLLSNVQNKSIECMMLHKAGNDVNQIRAVQNFIGESRWDDGPILRQHWSEVEKDLGDKNGVLILDGSDFPKQGTESVGVKRQWCGQLGKTANCQAGVFLGYASQKGYTLLHRSLYLPEEWLTDDGYAKRRQKCNVPEGLTFQTKPQLGLEMIRQVSDAGTLSFRWLTCDEAFGRDTRFLDAAGEYLSYFAEVPHDTRLWQKRPETAVPEWSGRGRKPTRERVVTGEPQPQTVVEIATQLPLAAWSRQTIKEGSKGPIEADFAHLRVVAVRDDLPGPDLWLVFRRNPVTGELKAYLSNAHALTTLATFVWLSGMRWPVEICFEDGKQELGLGDYQTRSWIGWHHHMTLCILAHFFLVRLQLRLKDDAPDLTLQQTILLLQAVLPIPEFDAALALDIVHYRQERNFAAYRSHRKKRINETKVSL
ncbi:MAG: IS701 family transposase [Caldilineaceae bacterium]|nr:IS701 family transposase [Caldilineaceae bacterium]